MSKKHLGDKFIVEIKEVLESNNGTLYRSNFSTLVFDDYGLDKLQKYDEIGHKLELIDELKQAEYNRGLNDAWELAKKLINTDHMQRNEIFGLDSSCNGIRDVYERFEPQEALAKIEAYEKEKSEIEVGDVVRTSCGDFAVITADLLDGRYNIVYESGLLGGAIPKNLLEKTGKHLDIADLLKQIGE